MDGPVEGWSVKYRSSAKPVDSRVLVGSLLKGVALVEAFLGGPTELTLTELARRTGYPTPTVHRLLATLEHAGWVARGRSGGYVLTLHIAELARHVLAGINLRDQALTAMQDLSQRTGETSYLVVREADHAVCVERVESYNMVRIMSWDVGSILPMYAGAAPLAMLAFEPAEERNRVLRSGPLEAPIGGRLDPDAVQTRLAEFRVKGYSLSIEETIPGIGSIGAPVFGGDGRVTAGVSIGGLASTMTGERLDWLAESVSQAGELISRRIGYSGTYPPPDAETPPTGRRAPAPRSKRSTDRAG